MMSGVKMMQGGGGGIGKSSDAGIYPQKMSQFRKYNGPTPSVRVETKPKVSHVVDSSHIPTVSANGIPGAAETTVTNLRTTANNPQSVPTGTILSNSITEDKGGASDGVLGKKKTAMCLVNELSRFNKVSV